MRFNPLLILIASAFGPYIGFGARLEHVVIMSLIAWLILSGKVSISRCILFLILAQTLNALWCLAVAVIVYPADFNFGALAALDNLIQPVLVILITASVFRGAELEKCERLFQSVVITAGILLSINTLISILAIFIDVWPFVQFFVTGETGSTGRSVWQNAFSNGRYSGIFNQPLEAGLAYSVALLSWCYLFRSSSISGAWFNIVLPLLLIIGGVLTVSKVFVLGGVAVCAFYIALTLNRSTTFRPELVIGAGVFLALGIVSANVLESSWFGFSYLSRLISFGLEPSELIRTYTAGRFDTESSVVLTNFMHVVDDSPFTGFGLGSLTVSVDSGFLEYFYQGGVLSLLVYISIIVFILLRGLTIFSRARIEGLFLIALSVLIIGASMGGPVFTSNRTSILLWVILSSFLLMVRRKMQQLSPKLTDSTTVNVCETDRRTSYKAEDNVKVL